MRQTPYIAIIIFGIILFLIDFYVFKGFKKIKLNLNKTIKTILTIGFWIVPIITIAALSIMIIFRNNVNAESVMVYFNYFSGTFLLFYIPKLIFLIFNILDDIFHFIKFLFHKLKHRKLDNSAKSKISRSTFLTRVGLIIAGIPFISIIYGIGWGRFNFIVRKSNLFFKNLPSEFDGFKIVQISDFHLGSFVPSKDKVEEVVKLANAQNPDLILFTGDLVNNFATEIEPFVKILSKLKAKHGMYSILGNHDYGEYVPWKSPELKEENVFNILKLEELIGFKTLLNSSTKVEKGNSSFSLIGVENWGLPPFPQYGNLKSAMENVENDSFKILMSHDPTHWEAEVTNKTNIDLTLSGHTHGAQFGIEIPGWRWSPVNLRYKHWGGIYKNGKQVLNVNTGIGFIGFPGRIGMPPEIGLITLKKA